MTSGSQPDDAEDCAVNPCNARNVRNVHTMNCACLKLAIMARRKIIEQDGEGY